MVKSVYAGGVLALGLLLAAPAAATDPSVRRVADEHDGRCGPSSGLPQNVRLPSELRPRVRTMLQRSATFRAQCLRLEETPWMRVAVRLDPGLANRVGFRAMSVIQRPQPKLAVVIVTLDPAADPSLWLSHEFEHLIEQFDGVDLKALARRHRAVWRSGEDIFETERAQRAGRVVFDEVRSHPEDDSFVE